MADMSDCPDCGEWRDSPHADCANCGFCGHYPTEEADRSDTTLWLRWTPEPGSVRLEGETADQYEVIENEDGTVTLRWLGDRPEADPPPSPASGV